MKLESFIDLSQAIGWTERRGPPQIEETERNEVLRGRTQGGKIEPGNPAGRSY